MAPKRCCILSSLLAIACVSFHYVIPGNAAQFEVIVGPGLEYHPRFLEINVGDTVVWKWAYPKVGQVLPNMNVVAGKVPHTITKSVSLERKCEKDYNNPNFFNTNVQLSGYQMWRTFNQVEDVTYHCETTIANCRLGMWGQIRVLPGGARSEQVDSSKFQLGGTRVLPGILGSAVDNVRKDFYNIFGK